MVFIFLAMLLVRFVQGFFISDVSFWELKWLLLGEWVASGFSMYSETFDYTGPLAVAFYKGIDLVLGRSAVAHSVFSTLIIIFQAGVFNQSLLKNKVFSENSYLPGFLYSMLMVSVPDFMALSPQLISLTFILLALRNVLRRIDNQATDELFLNSGFFVGIASIVYLPSVVFFLVFLFALVLFSTAVTRRLILYLFGFVLVITLCSLYFYWLGDFNAYFQSFFVQSFTLSAQRSLGLVNFLCLTISFAVIFLLSVSKTLGSARLTNFQQKIQQVLWLMFFGGIATFFLSNEKAGHELVFLVPTLAYFFNHYFMLLKKPFFRMIMPGLLIFGLIGYSIFSYQHFIGGLLVGTEVADREEQTMVLGADFAFYKNIDMNTPCFHPELTAAAFEGLNYYQSAGDLYDLFEKSNPRVIVDQMNAAPGIFNRFPVLMRNYDHLGGGVYYRKD